MPSVKHMSDTKPTFLCSNKRVMPMHEFLVLQSEKAYKISAMSMQVCPAVTLSSGKHIESGCHVPDARSDHRCFADEDCGVDSTTCRRRSCSMAGYCGLWFSV